MVRLSDLIRLPADPPAAHEPGPPAGEPAAALYARAHGEVREVVRAAEAGRPVSVERLAPVAALLARSVPAEDQLLQRAMAGAAAGDLAQHMLNVAIVAVKIGGAAGCDPRALERVALAACLHDIGMLIFPAILEKRGALTAGEAAQLRRHPLEGCRLLEPLGPEAAWLARVALHEHEREDGSGYPGRLAGDAIHPYAKIVAIADVYEALTHARSFREKSLPVAAVKELVAAERRRFPDALLKALLHAVSAAPLGSLVRLSNRETARVVATNARLPLRPVVEVVVGPRGERLRESRRIDLAGSTLLHIVEALPYSLHEPGLRFLPSQS